MPTSAVAAHHEDEDKISSEANLWLPRTVVKRHRTLATVIWVCLITAFLSYISFIVWDTVDSRRDPAASFQLKQEVYTFPDVAVCMTPYEGCLASNSSHCAATASFTMISQIGFLNETLEVDAASLEIEEEFTLCKVLPASKLQVNQTGVDNGDITFLTARFGLFWVEDPNDEYDPTEYRFNQQFASLFFLNVDDGVEAIGTEINDAKLPYERVVPINGETMTMTTSHLVLDLMEFEPISTTSGKKREAEKTFTQSSTSGKFNWHWDGDDSEWVVAALLFDLFIAKFEYTSIEEVDPVDAWAIIGAIGGVWQFVVIAFGLFFVFSEKQAPDKKLRNFRKTVVKPASIVTSRFSSGRHSSGRHSSGRFSIFSSRASITEDPVVDASGEDLPVEWVKRQRKDGSFYYSNTRTGAVQNRSPHEGIEDAAGAPEARHPRGTARAFQRATSFGRSSVKAVEGPIAHYRRNSRSSAHSSSSVGNAGGVGGAAPPSRPTFTAPFAPAYDGPPPPPIPTAPSYRTAMSVLSSSDGGTGTSSLPPGWDRRTTDDGKTYYAHAMTRVTQWNAPHM